LIAGCNAGSTREVIDFALGARELGYDAILLSVPHTSRPSQPELAAHFEPVAKEVGLPEQRSGRHRAPEAEAGRRVSEVASTRPRASSACTARNRVAEIRIRVSNPCLGTVAIGTSASR